MQVELFLSSPGIILAPRLAATLTLVGSWGVGLVGYCDFIRREDACTILHHGFHEEFVETYITFLFIASVLGMGLMDLIQFANLRQP